MLIKNARWLNYNGKFQEGRILINSDKVKALGKNIPVQNVDYVFDAKDMILLPGTIDPHVHFRQPGHLYKEGVANASKAALKGGVTTILDMPNNKPPCTTVKRLLEKKEIFNKKSLVNWGLQLHSTTELQTDSLQYIKTAKVYMAKSSALPAITEAADLIKIFEFYPVVTIHAEDETQFDNSPHRSLLHHENRPRQAVISALQKIEQALDSIAADKRPRVVICHMNTADEVDWIERKKSEGFDVWGETAPHYLFFTQDDYNRGGAKFKVNPPIRGKRDQVRLAEGLVKGVIDFIGTDHAPHTTLEKISGSPPSGIAGIEWLLPVMLQFKEKSGMNWKRFKEIMTQNASRCFNIDKRDGIKQGNFADLIFIKKGKSMPGSVQTRANVNIYENFHLDWQVLASMVNGIFKYRAGKFISSKNGFEV